MAYPSYVFEYPGIFFVPTASLSGCPGPHNREKWNRCYCKHPRPASFDLDHGAAILAPVPHLPPVRRFDLLKVIVPLAPFLITLRAPAVAQLIGVDGQVTVTAPQDGILSLQQDKIRVPA